ncbi:hypothetical protein FN846DRAFT_787568 [Sphaerosporella brunnea]|uniref:Kinesin light chain n=1 Tax=Sphaerosporella brunnea TaxID=1250544 RepID=A0A5J5EEA1_9PEZI|nr:hypothetical protein FN846DRAFT_787568 [Sphaerosporella brunnea]
MANFASTYRKQGGRSNEAETLEIRAMEARKRVLGDDHQKTLLSITLSYHSAKRWEEAEVLEKQVMEA